ncbi:hypothetical protein NDU88_007476 [Pleurodeles waltl]|uniref:Uncharacterized protein n=1 Tax=Pleurodeles waltl TaxID=8319 RepID=A0AAV7VSP8_PLEWA|nr:hypothetical protein NDU88_007476 [Pleurodeles waltl]
MRKEHAFRLMHCRCADRNRRRRCRRLRTPSAAKPSRAVFQRDTGVQWCRMAEWLQSASQRRRGSLGTPAGRPRLPLDDKQ